MASIKPVKPREVRLGMELRDDGPFVLVQLDMRVSGAPIKGRVHVLFKKTKTACDLYVNEHVKVLWRGSATLINCTTCAANLVAHVMMSEET